jgi:uncharacterized iron-regulated protein
MHMCRGSVRGWMAGVLAFIGLAMASPLAAATVEKVAATYADIAQAGYEDSLVRARELKTAIDQMIQAPTETNLAAARKAWIAARVPYMQTEAFRFGNKIVDDWEGRVNAWPLDEGLIDYVDESYGTASDSNPLYTADGDPLTAIFTGLGSLSYGELAGERMKLGLLLNDPEEEHDCFSDNTHNSHYYNVIGIENVYFGRYERIDGRVVEGPSVSDLVRAKSAEIDERVRAALALTNERMTALKKRADGGEAYDQMLDEDNKEGNAVIEGAIESLIAQAKELERAVAVLELRAVTFEGSDSLDNPAKALDGSK